MHMYLQVILPSSLLSILEGLPFFLFSFSFSAKQGLNFLSCVCSSLGPAGGASVPVPSYCPVANRS